MSNYRGKDTGVVYIYSVHPVARVGLGLAPKAEHDIVKTIPTLAR